MSIHDFLGFFDFRLEKYEDGYGVIDEQGANLGNIESERFDNFCDIVERFDGSIYIADYIDDFLDEDGYEGDYSTESKYEWCEKNNHYFKDILYAFLHPESVKDYLKEIEKILDYLKYHSKNLTNKQYYKVEEAIEYMNELKHKEA